MQKKKRGGEEQAEIGKCRPQRKWVEKQKRVTTKGAQYGKRRLV